MFSNKYPYTDFHELNLDWILASISRLNKTITHVYETAEEMIADRSTAEDTMVLTKGFHSLNDGGAGLYFISKTDTIGIKLSNDLFANLMIKDTINVKCLGAYGDGIHDDSAALEKAFTSMYDVTLPTATYLIQSRLHITHSNKTVHGNGSTILAGRNILNSTHIITIGSISENLTNITIENLIIDGNIQERTSTGTSACIASRGYINSDGSFTYSDYVTIRNCKTFNNQGVGIINSGTRSGEDIKHRSRGNIIEYCETINCLQGCVQSCCLESVIQHCLVENCMEGCGANNYSRYCDVLYNTVRNPRDGGVGAVGCDGGIHIRIIGNNIVLSTEIGDTASNGIIMNANTGTGDYVIIANNIINGFNRGIYFKDKRNTTGFYGVHHCSIHDNMIIGSKLYDIDIEYGLNHIIEHNDMVKGFHCNDLLDYLKYSVVDIPFTFSMADFSNENFSIVGSLNSSHLTVCGLEVDFSVQFGKTTGARQNSGDTPFTMPFPPASYKMLHGGAMRLGDGLEFRTFMTTTGAVTCQGALWTDTTIAENDTNFFIATHYTRKNPRAV